MGDHRLEQGSAVWEAGANQLDVGLHDRGFGGSRSEHRDHAESPGVIDFSMRFLLIALWEVDEVQEQREKIQQGKRLLQ